MLLLPVVLQNLFQPLPNYFHSNDTKLHHLFVSWTLGSVICILLSHYQPPFCQLSMILDWTASLGTLNFLPILLHLSFPITLSMFFWRIPQTRQSWSGQWDPEKLWGVCKSEVMLDTPAGRSPIVGEPGQTVPAQLGTAQGAQSWSWVSPTPLQQRRAGIWSQIGKRCTVNAENSNFCS